VVAVIGEVDSAAAVGFHPADSVASPVEGADSAAAVPREVGRSINLSNPAINCVHFSENQQDNHKGHQ
jgi:hypothetical protein